YAQEQMEKKAAKKAAVDIPERVPRKGGKAVKGGKGVELDVVNVDSRKESTNTISTTSWNKSSKKKKNPRSFLHNHQNKGANAKAPPKTPAFVEDTEDEVIPPKPAAKRGRKAKPKSTEEAEADVPTDVSPPKLRTRAPTARKSKNRERRVIREPVMVRKITRLLPILIGGMRIGKTVLISSTSYDPPNSPSGRSGAAEQEIYLYTG
ncbi:hypothetical protein HK104_006809, partial [Borealophlyctis nickersoniae]